ncbi:MAG: transposase [Gallionella sp.]|nr:transposase [Gallionella sp.]
MPVLSLSKRLANKKTIAGMARSYKNMRMPLTIMVVDKNNLWQHKPGHAALRKGRASVANGVYLITATTIERARIFENFHAACAASRCFENRAVLGDATMLAWVLMTDHAHWLIELGEHDALSSVVNRIKSASARHMNVALMRNGALWSKGFHDHALRAEDDLPDTARYVVANPLRAGLVNSLGDYPFWNAAWL